MKILDMFRDIAGKDDRQCPRCDVKMKRGVALAPVVGSPGTPMGYAKGYCVMPITSAMVPCVKCPKCGHSVMFSKLYC